MINESYYVIPVFQLDLTKENIMSQEKEVVVYNSGTITVTTSANSPVGKVLTANTALPLFNHEPTIIIKAPGVSVVPHITNPQDYATKIILRPGISLKLGEETYRNDTEHDITYNVPPHFTDVLVLAGEVA